ncbi:MAG: cyclic nucleotide-binding domain-containing protein [Deltaproteobacteria bacterium]|nr:cyclic nucleotide-binding domain-containing protein [Deltaproteobacteria bacterium]
MKCPNCEAELAQEPRFCSECGCRISSGAPVPRAVSAPKFAAEEDLASVREAEALRPPAGFSRTLSTDLVAKQIEVRTVAKLAALIQSRTYQSGEVMIKKGEMVRDLFVLTEGRVQISRKEGDGDLILNEIEPPYILGEIAFLFGMPRTATAIAKTEVKTFVLRYEDLNDLIKVLPAWLPTLLTSLASDIKSLHHKARVLETRLLELEGPGSRRA